MAENIENIIEIFKDSVENQLESDEMRKELLKMQEGTLSITVQKLKEITSASRDTKEVNTTFIEIKNILDLYNVLGVETPISLYIVLRMHQIQDMMELIFKVRSDREKVNMSDGEMANINFLIKELEEFNKLESCNTKEEYFKGMQNCTLKAAVEILKGLDCNTKQTVTTILIGIQESLKLYDFGYRATPISLYVGLRIQQIIDIMSVVSSAIYQQYKKGHMCTSAMYHKKLEMSAAERNNIDILIKEIEAFLS